MKQVQAELPYFNHLIGGWPTRIQGGKELQEVMERWTKTLKIVQSLVKERPDSLEAKYLLADLLRMGHNIDIAGAAQASHSLLKEIIQTDPNHFKAHLSLASLYVSVDPQAAPLAERLFLKAQELAAPKVHPVIFQGLGFACVYQNKIPDAISYFESYLQLQVDSKIEQLLHKIKSGKKINITYQDLPTKQESIYGSD